MNMKKISITSMCVFFLLLILLYGNNFVSAQDISHQQSYDNSKNVLRSGEEVHGIGEYHIGEFTFTNNNLTPVKTMPEGARTLRFNVKFKKADIDRGIGQVKLNVQVRDINGNIVTQRTLADIAGTQGGLPRITSLNTDTINVSPGEKYQIFFDASSVNPEESNGNYRSITVYSFTSYINV